MSIYSTSMYLLICINCECQFDLYRTIKTTHVDQCALHDPHIKQKPTPITIRYKTNDDNINNNNESIVKYVFHYKIFQRFVLL